VFYTSGLPSGSPAISFLELPINVMRFSALRPGRTVQSQEVFLYKEFYVYVC